MIYVVRHGEVPSNVEKIISGWSKEELTNKGIMQANYIMHELQGIEFAAVFSSPIYRALQTARIVAPQKEIICDERLAEREPGTMLGKSRKEIDKKEWNSLTQDRTKEGAETLAAGLKRVKSILDEIHESYKDENVLIVTHNFVSKCIWIIENKIEDPNQIATFFHNNDEIKTYDTLKLKR